MQFINGNSVFNFLNVQMLVTLTNFFRFLADSSVFCTLYWTTSHIGLVARSGYSWSWVVSGRNLFNCSSFDCLLKLRRYWLFFQDSIACSTPRWESSSYVDVELKMRGLFLYVVLLGNQWCQRTEKQHLSGVCWVLKPCSSQPSIS